MRSGDSIRRVPCPVCSRPSSRFLPYRGIHAREPLLVEAFRGRWASHCSSCDHVFCEPPPDPALLDRYYASFESSKEDAAGGLRARVRRSFLGRLLLTLRARLRLERWTVGREQLDALERHVAPAERRTWLRGERVLEVGAGSAVFSRIVRARFGTAVSCDIAEPSTSYVDTYRRHRLTVVSPTLDGVPDESRYRIIHSAHVLEHLTDPRAAFEKLRRLLHPKGLVFTEVPNCEAPYWEVFRYPDPPHVQFFTPSSFRALANGCGFRVLSLETAGARIADDPGLLLADSPEVIDEHEIDRLVAIRRSKLGDPTRVAAASGPRENLRLVMQFV